MIRVSVSAPSRIHFGLLRLHETAEQSFGGLGLMIDRPRVELEITAANAWQATGPSAGRAVEFAKLALAAAPDAPIKPPALRVHVASTIPQHRGLGGGTQLALSAAAAVRGLLGLPPGSAVDLAAAVGRGARSAVGSHGFVLGGLIWEKGRAAGAQLGALSVRAVVPNDWRVVLVAPPRQVGLSGPAESKAFERLPTMPASTTQRLILLAENEILPAARHAEIYAFGHAVYEYGRLSGECFAAVQGGPYASDDVARLVAAIREFGVPGAGQSSWGPTTFAVVGNEAVASQLVARLREDARWSSHEFEIAAADNRGAVVQACANVEETRPRDYSNP